MAAGNFPVDRGLQAALMSGLLAGCSMLYQPRNQCERDSDCVRLSRTAAELKGFICEDHVCVAPQQVPRDCESNNDCIKAARGEAAVCRNYRCVQLRTGACNQLVNADAISHSDDVVVLGAFYAMNNPEPGRLSGLNSIKMAAVEFQDRVGGASGYTSTIRRPFVFVVCDSQQTDQLDASFDHLTKVLRVPVVVTAQPPAVLSMQWARLRQDKLFDSMFISPFASDSSLDFLASEGHVWSLLGDPVEDLAAAYVQLARYQLAKVTARPARLVMIVNGSTAMQDIADFVERDLALNDMPLADAAQLGRFRNISLADRAPDEFTAKVAQALAEVDPDLVVVLAGVEAIQAAVLANEARVATTQTPGSATGKYYVLSHHLYNTDDLRAVMPLDIDSASLDKRILGVNYAGAVDRHLYNSYFSHLTSNYDGAVGGYENYYDAAHFAMLAVAGVASRAATADIDGALAVKGFKRLIDMSEGNLKFDLEREKLPELVSHLESNFANYWVNGTLGEPNFSMMTGARRTGASLWCFRQNWGRAGALEYAADKVRYSPAEDAFDGDPANCQKSVPAP